MAIRVVYVHGNQTTHWSFGWAARVRDEVEVMGFDTFFETMPDSVLARQEYWLPFLNDHVKVTKDDILLGCSSGAVAAMRFAESNAVRGSVLVSPSYTDTNDEMERLSGYFDKPWDWNAIRSHQERIELISADDDPYIPQDEFRVIAESLGVHWTKLNTGGHFIDRSEFPEVLDAVRRIAEQS